MKKKEIIEGIVTRVDFPNKGVIETADGKCIVKNALPGQKVSCRVQKVRKNYAECALLEVLEDAPDAVSSPCKHTSLCHMLKS